MWRSERARERENERESKRTTDRPTGGTEGQEMGGGDNRARDGRCGENDDVSFIHTNT